MTEGSTTDFRFASTGDYSPRPPVALTITSRYIAGDRYAGFLYPVSVTPAGAAEGAPCLHQTTNPRQVKPWETT